MRIVLDVTATTGNRIQGTASWVNGGQPVPFSGWLALMRLFEDASRGQEDKPVHQDYREGVNCRADELPGSAGGP
jgi:hypothetical protein